MTGRRRGVDSVEVPGASRLPKAPACPFCEGSQTELLNAFGAHASVSSYWCRDCRSPFELLKWGGSR
ncbi:MAG: hypothetical protein KJP18_05535 [Gemmatimonadetes bacterium]|nr:hypothetical protein [Gemmatimonadota bacterium]